MSKTNSNNSNPDLTLHSIQAVADKAGLTPDVIRIWERRYNAVSPQRTAGNQRQYDDHDVQRLKVLKALTQHGHRISAVASLELSELKKLLPENPAMVSHKAPQQTYFQDQAWNAITHFDAPSLENLLNKTLIEVGSVTLLQNYLEPLLIAIGKAWRQGKLRTSEEHFATSHIRSYLGRQILAANSDNQAPYIVISTPPGEYHEMGATMAAVCAAQSGWQVLYLGAATPAEEILYCVHRTQARAVAISMGYCADDPGLLDYLSQLSPGLPQRCALIAGGAGARPWQDAITQQGGQVHSTLRDFSAALDQIRLH